MVCILRLYSVASLGRLHRSSRLLHEGVLTRQISRIHPTTLEQRSTMSWLQVDTHVSPPIKRKKAEDVNVVYDRYGSSMAFYKDVPGILLQLKEHPDVHVAVASRTSAPDAYVNAILNLSPLGTKG
jgi:hypothetical protein